MIFVIRKETGAGKHVLTCSGFDWESDVIMRVRKRVLMCIKQKMEEGARKIFMG